MYDAPFITEIPDGQTVEASGAYRMSMDWYHSQKVCNGPSVSSTGLRKITLQSPHAFWKTWGGNPNRYPDKEPGDGMVFPIHRFASGNGRCHSNPRSGKKLLLFSNRLKAKVANEQAGFIHSVVFPSCFLAFVRPLDL